LELIFKVHHRVWSKVPIAVQGKKVQNRSDGAPTLGTAQCDG